MISNAEKWNTWNANYAPKYPHEKIIQFFFRNFPKDARGDIVVLDLGCGSGVHTEFLLNEGFKVYATDISPKGVENTLERVKQSCKNLPEVCVQTIGSINYPENFFDVIFSVGVFDAAGYGETQKAVPLISKCLKPEGKGFFIFASNSDFRINKNPYHIYGYNEEEVNSLFVRSGLFQNVWIDRYITTYQNQVMEQNDFIITTFK